MPSLRTAPLAVLIRVEAESRRAETPPLHVRGGSAASAASSCSITGHSAVDSAATVSLVTSDGLVTLGLMELPLERLHADGDVEKWYPLHDPVRPSHPSLFATSPLTPLASPSPTKATCCALRCISACPCAAE